MVQKTKCRPIYEVIDEDYIKNSNIFPDDFITKCKKCPNEPQNISSDVKNNINVWKWNKVYMHRLSCFGERT